LVDIDDDVSDINVDAASRSSNSRVKSYLFNFKIIKSIRKNNINNNKSNNNSNSNDICHEDHDTTAKRLDYPIYITPLMLACYYGKLSVVRELLWRRFDLLSVDSESNSLLHYLSRCRHKDYLDIILGKKIQYCHRLAY
jgi:ankyrin repeat protein